MKGMKGMKGMNGYGVVTFWNIDEWSDQKKY